MKNILTMVACLFLLVGCSANFKSIYRNPDFKNGQSALVDIKQRAIINKYNPYFTSNDPKKHPLFITCSEDPPDSLSAFAEQLAIALDVEGKTFAEIASAGQEQAAYVGIRTAGLQFFVKNQFHICLAFGNGAIDAATYDILMRRNQKNIVALVAIESLTSAARTPPVVLNNNGSANASQRLAKLKEFIVDVNTEISENAEAIATLETQISDKQKLHDKEQDTTKKKVLADELKVLKDKLSVATTVKTSLEETQKAALKSLETGDAVSVSGTSSGEIGFIATLSSLNSNTVDKVSAAVQAITEQVINTDDSGQLCIAYFRSSSTINKNLEAYCKTRLNQMANYNAALIKLLEKAIEENKLDIANYLADQLQNSNSVMLNNQGLGSSYQGLTK